MINVRCLITFPLQTTAGRSQSRADNGGVTQLDGPGDSSDDEDDVDDDDDDDVEEEDDHDDEEIDADNDENADEEPLNSEDDVTDDDPSVLFETDNVVVCQYDKVRDIFFKQPRRNSILNDAHIY